MILKDKNRGIFTVKVVVGDYFGMEEQDLWVVLREPTAEEALSFKDISNKQNETVDEKKMFDMIPAMIIDHNFEEDTNKKMSTDEVWKLIMQRAACATEVITKWSKNIPLAKGKLEK